MRKILKIFFVGFIFLLLPLFVLADYPGDRVVFNVDSSYDKTDREEVTATLVVSSARAYFYIDNKWWSYLDSDQRKEIKKSLEYLGSEFEHEIYPTLTSIFGYERKPGIDSDYNITVLIHPMVDEARGYFREVDEYEKEQNPFSNEREMVYLNAEYINSSLIRSFLAHEFIHLITFNQKQEKNGSTEEVWLNEARAEIAPTLMGYDETYEESYLEERVNAFLKNPSDSITEWRNVASDYGALNLFTHYLVEKYGIGVLVDSLKSEKVGIESINYALKRKGYKEDFSEIFTDWTIAVSANDCSLGEEYCYLDKNLKRVHVSPSINFLPLQGESSLGVNQSTKNWSGNWIKFIGGNSDLQIQFIGNPDNLFKVPYLLKDEEGKYSLGFFELDENQRGEILISRVNGDVGSVIIIPSVQSKQSDFLSLESQISYSWEAKTVASQEEPEEDQEIVLDKPILEMNREEILTKISGIEKLLGSLKLRLVQLEKDSEKDQEIVSEDQEVVSCDGFNSNLFYGLINDNRVKCLQQFLKFQGVYPEGLITGNFLNLTKAAVVRFQEKYSGDILAPWGINSGTGFVGKTTLSKINELLSR